MFKKRPAVKWSVDVKGLFSAPIPYLVRVENNDWTQYLCPFLQQSYGNHDSDSCWCVSACNSFAIQMKYLWMTGQFSDEAKAFFISNGYCDQQGNFAVSPRFHEILCGNKDNGGTSPEAWQSFAKRGHIPLSMLTYTVEQSNRWATQAQFDADYFNPVYVTPAMTSLAKQFLQYVNIASQRIGTEFVTPNMQVLVAAMKQAPLNYGVPVNVSQWNQVNVPIDYLPNGKLDTTPVHEVTGYAFVPTGYASRDQYQPEDKVLANGYFLAGVYQGIVTAITPAVVVAVPQPVGEESDSFWTAVMAFWNGLISKTIQIGRVWKPTPQI